MGRVAHLSPERAHPDDNSYRHPRPEGPIAVPLLVLRLRAPRVRPYVHDLVQGDLTGSVGRHYARSALEAMPPFAWPRSDSDRGGFRAGAPKWWQR